MISKLEHPLEMLSTEEISLAYEIYKTSEGYDEATHFSQISLVEPSKELLKDFKQGDPFQRQVRLVGRDSAFDGGFVAKICYYLICIHVCTCSRPSLKNINWKLFSMFISPNLFCSS